MALNRRTAHKVYYVNHFVRNSLQLGLRETRDHCVSSKTPREDAIAMTVVMGNG